MYTEDSMMGYLYAPIVTPSQNSPASYQPARTQVTKPVAAMPPYKDCCFPPSVLSVPRATSSTVVYPSDEEILATLMPPPQVSKASLPAQESRGTATRYEGVRAPLMERAYLGLINGRDVNDVHFEAYSSRSSHGKRGNPRTVHALSSILEAASPTLKEYLARRKAPGVRLVHESLDDDYGDDSDLEDCDDESEEVTQQETRNTATRPTGDPTAMWSPYPKSGIISSRKNKRDANDEAYIRCISGATARTTTPQSVSVKGKEPVQVIVREIEDEDMDEYCTDFDDTSSVVSISTRSEYSPSRSNNHSSGTVCDARIAEELSFALKGAKITQEMDAYPGEVTAHQGTTFAVPYESHVVPHGAYRTWQALILYLYNDRIVFSLRTEEQRSQNQQACSPKSMYMLASKFGLEQLQKEAQQALEERLSERNIVQELFSDFTWRHADIISMEASVFRRLASHPKVQQDFEDVCKKIANGHYPKSADILSYLAAPMKT